MLYKNVVFISACLLVILLIPPLTTPISQTRAGTGEDPLPRDIPVLDITNKLLICPPPATNPFCVREYDYEQIRDPYGLIYNTISFTGLSTDTSPRTTLIENPNLRYCSIPGKWESYLIYKRLADSSSSFVLNIDHSRQEYCQLQCANGIKPEWKTGKGCCGTNLINNCNQKAGNNQCILQGTNAQWQDLTLTGTILANDCDYSRPNLIANNQMYRCGPTPPSYPATLNITAYPAYTPQLTIELEPPVTGTATFAVPTDDGTLSKTITLTPANFLCSGTACIDNREWARMTYRITTRTTTTFVTSPPFEYILETFIHDTSENADYVEDYRDNKFFTIVTNYYPIKTGTCTYSTGPNTTTTLDTSKNRCTTIYHGQFAPYYYTTNIPNTGITVSVTAEAAISEEAASVLSWRGQPVVSVSKQITVTEQEAVVAQLNEFDEFRTILSKLSTQPYRFVITVTKNGKPDTDTIARFKTQSFDIPIYQDLNRQSDEPPGREYWDTAVLLNSTSYSRATNMPIYASMKKEGSNTNFFQNLYNLPAFNPALPTGKQWGTIFRTYLPIGATSYALNRPFPTNPFPVTNGIGSTHDFLCAKDNNNGQDTYSIYECGGEASSFVAAQLTNLKRTGQSQHPERTIALNNLGSITSTTGIRSFLAKNNLNPEQGRIDLTFQPNWNPRDTGTQTLFSWETQDLGTNPYTLAVQRQGNTLTCRNTQAAWSFTNDTTIHQTWNNSITYQLTFTWNTTYNLGATNKNEIACTLTNATATTTARAGIHSIRYPPLDLNTNFTIGGKLASASSGAQPANANIIKAELYTNITRKELFCSDDKKWREDLDLNATRVTLSTAQKTCEGTSDNSTGFIWTGTRCCSEPQDWTTREYYSENYGTITGLDDLRIPVTDKKHIGACWDSKFIPGTPGVNLNNVRDPGQDAPQQKDILHPIVENGRIINYAGQFYSCGQTPQDIQQKITARKIVTANNKTLIQPTTTCQIMNYTKFDNRLNNYVCQVTGKWQEITGGTIVIKQIIPALTGNNNYPQQACLGASQCWNGTNIISDSRYDTTLNTTQYGYRCENGNWEQRPPQKTWTNEEGYCPTSTQCLVQLNTKKTNDTDNNKPLNLYKTSDNDKKPACIASGQYYEDYYCYNGKWTTRTATIATELTNYVKGKGVNDYTLTCDTSNSTLNTYTTDGATLIKINNPDAQFSTLITNGCQPLLGGRTTNCINNICTITYTVNGENLVALGTSLNTPINSSTAPFLKLFNKDKNFCNNVPYGLNSQFTLCSNTNITKTHYLYYNPATQSALILPKNTPLSFAGSNAIIQNLPEFQFAKQKILAQPQKLLPFQSTRGDFVNDATLFNQLYIVKKGTTQIFSVYEKNQYDPYNSDATRKVKQDYIITSYRGATPNINVCGAFNNLKSTCCVGRNNRGEYNSTPLCAAENPQNIQLENNEYLIIGQTAKQFTLQFGTFTATPVPPATGLDMHWKDITTKLRTK